MPLSPGTRVSAYEIVEPIGAGGMGEVYRAHDTRLGRDVALKILPAELAKDADRVKRFEQEARATAALSHPNILAVYDVGDANGVLFVASELLEGQTMREALLQPVTPAKACAWGSQVALGLAAAHARNIVHRDIKPENLFITADGRVKILDFGLARVGATASGSDSATALGAGRPETQAGVVLGTVAYMSPEQARGLQADARSDIFSLGVVLYELIAGRAPFGGASAVESMHATLTADPPDLDQSRVPPSLDRIIRRCLEKRPEDRFHSAHDLALALEAVGGSRSQTAVSIAQLPARKSRTAAMAAVLAAVAVVSAVATYWLTRSEPSPLPSFQRITFRRGTTHTARFEPGTKNVVYSARWQGDPPAMYSVRANSPESQPVGESDTIVLAISSAQQAAVLRSPRLMSGRIGGTLAVMPLGGGGARDLATRIMAADFTADGQLAAAEYTGDLNRIHLPVGKVLYETTSGPVTDLRCEPHGGRIALTTFDDIRVIDAGGVLLHTLKVTGVTGIDWSPDGKELWYSQVDGPGQTTIVASRLDGAPGRRVWRGRRVALQDIAADGTLLVVEEQLQDGVFVQRDGSATAVDLSWLDGTHASAISPSGDALLFSETGDAGGGFYIRKLDGSPAVRLGGGFAMDIAPAGDRVLASKDLHTHTVVPTGAGTPRDFPHPEVWSFFAWFHPDGRRLFVNGRIKDAPYRFWWMDDSGKFTEAGPSGLDHWAGQVPLSNDGRLLAAFKSGQGMTHTVAIYPLDGGSAFPIAGMRPDEVAIRFAAGDRHLFVYDRDRLPAQIFKLDYRTGQRTLFKEFAPADPAGITSFRWIVMTPDGRVVAYNYRRAMGTVYQISGLK
jgi:serine/threonine protein kinase